MTSWADKVEMYDERIATEANEYSEPLCNDMLADMRELIAEVERLRGPKYMVMRSALEEIEGGTWFHGATEYERGRLGQSLMCSNIARNALKGDE